MKKSERATSKKVVTPFEETYAEVLQPSFLLMTAYLGVLAKPTFSQNRFQDGLGVVNGDARADAQRDGYVLVKSPSPEPWASPTASM